MAKIISRVAGKLIETSYSIGADEDRKSSSKAILSQHVRSLVEAGKKAGFSELLKASEEHGFAPQSVNFRGLELECETVPAPLNTRRDRMQTSAKTPYIEELNEFDRFKDWGVCEALRAESVYGLDAAYVPVKSLSCSSPVSLVVNLGSSWVEVKTTALLRHFTDCGQHSLLGTSCLIGNQIVVFVSENPIQIVHAKA